MHGEGQAIDIEDGCMLRGAVAHYDHAEHFRYCGRLCSAKASRLFDSGLLEPH